MNNQAAAARTRRKPTARIRFNVLMIDGYPDNFEGSALPLFYRRGAAADAISGPFLRGAVRPRSSSGAHPRVRRAAPGFFPEHAQTARLSGFGDSRRRSCAGGFPLRPGALRLPSPVRVSVSYLNPISSVEE